jgi:predicted nucleic acid-binding protein
VTGDNHLKQLAAQNGLTVHGIIWFLDEMVRLEIIAPQTAGEALQKIIAQGARLPIEECNKRLNLWG